MEGLHLKKYITAIVFLLLTACEQGNPTSLEIDMYNTVGDTLGTAQVTEQAEGVKINLDLSGLEPGDHAMHIHENGKCEGPDFKSAGDHFNPEEKQHGLLNTKGPHAGDLPNITVKDDGTFKGEIIAKNVTLLIDDKNSLLKKEGTALVIHEKKDDGMTDPAGNAGKRVACGEIKTEDQINEVEEDE